MDYRIDDVQGNGQQTWISNTDIRTNIWFSMHIDYGSWWHQPTFGNKLWTIKKLSDSNVLLAKQYVDEALAWLIQVGRAETISTIVERDTDPRYSGRLNIRIRAKQPDGLIISYQQWYQVI